MHQQQPAKPPRKQYQLSKQRERWTADEHSRFLEGLKLYGRAWAKIQGESVSY
jgi:hypothetical protein